MQLYNYLHVSDRTLTSYARREAVLLQGSMIPGSTPGEVKTLFFAKTLICKNPSNTRGPRGGAWNGAAPQGRVVECGAPQWECHAAGASRRG